MTDIPRAKSPPVVGTITEIVTTDKSGNPCPHGSYAVVAVDNFMRYVTFSLSEAWREEFKLDNENARGFSVVLEDLVMKSKRWRAYSARFVRPEDKDLLDSFLESRDSDPSVVIGEGLNINPEPEDGY
jgi:hypothetical protein